MSEAIEPTDEGKHRYPPTGYMTELRDPIACTCVYTCKALCAGECGCLACGLLFSMFCDEAGCFPETPADLEKAKRRYRGE